MRDVVVLGAGMAGVAAALHLQRRGWSVALVDRGEPGRETSFGNAGIIQAEAVEPYPMPRDIASLLKVATGRGNDVRYDLLALPGHVGALLRYWWHSAPTRHRTVSAAYAGVIARSTAEHQELMTAAGVPEGLVRRDGFRELHRSAALLDADAALAERLRTEFGVGYRRLSPAELAAAEPGLKVTGAGALHWLDSWTVRDPGALVAAYADLFEREGGTLLRGDAATLAAEPGGGFRLRTVDGPLAASAVVVALGPWSPELLRRFGYRVPMVRKRGYHRHYQATGRGLDLPLRDSDFGYVAAPMTAGLRITTGAEFAGAEAPPKPIQLGRAEAALRGLVDLGDPVETVPWLGTRPCMPDMLPVIGEAPRHPGLWLHFGHGHQGFTLGPATGRLLAEMMTGETPVVDPLPFSPARWCR